MMMMEVFLCSCSLLIKRSAKHISFYNKVKEQDFKIAKSLGIEPEEREALIVVEYRITGCKTKTNPNKTNPKLTNVSS